MLSAILSACANVMCFEKNYLEASVDDIYTGGGFNIRFKDGQLLSVGICSHCARGKKKPIIGTQDGKHFYMLPLTEQQFTEVSGPADRIYKVNEVRY